MFKATDYKGDLVEDLINEEGSEILFWVLDGAREYLAKHVGKIPVPASVKARSQSNVVESSAPLMWLHDMINSEELIIHTTGYMKDMIEPKDGYKMFCNWCFDNGEKVPTQKQWLKELEAYNKMPASKKGARPGGKSRVWGVMKSAVHDSRKLHSTTNDDDLDWAALQKDVFSASQVQ